ncbi:MAG: hypothetical protein AAFQ58_23145 [Pseudomonadota bacterium]
MTRTTEHCPRCKIVAKTKKGDPGGSPFMLYNQVVIGSGGRDRTYDQLINSYPLHLLIPHHANRKPLFLNVLKEKDSPY